MSLADLETRIEAALKKALPGLRELKVVDGDFSREVIRDARSSAPSVSLSTLRTQPLSMSSGAIRVEATVIFLVCGRRGAHQGERFTAKHLALRLVEQISVVLMRDFGATAIDFRDFTDPDDRRQVNSVVVGEARIGVIVEPDEDGQAALSRLLLGFTPETGPDHVDDYVEIGGAA